MLLLKASLCMAALRTLHGGVAGLVADLLLGEGLRLVRAAELEQRVRVQLAVDDVAAPPDDARLEFLQLPWWGSARQV